MRGRKEEARRVVKKQEEKVVGRKRKGSIKDRIDWGSKVEVVESEGEAETFLEESGLASMDATYSEKLKRPRMGMVADMVEREKRVPAPKRLHQAGRGGEVLRRKVPNKEPTIKKTLVNTDWLARGEAVVVVEEEEEVLRRKVPNKE